MPWKVEQGRGCPSDHPWAVVKSDTGEKVACHASKDGAQRQVDLLYAKEEQMSTQLDTTERSEPATTSRPDVVGMCVRAFDFEARSNGDGRTLEGYAAVFNQTTRIPAFGGDFDEVILPGAFQRSLEQRTPVLQFEHGRDPRVGRVPIGSIKDIHEDKRGLYLRAQLFDNPTVEPVRQAIAERAIRGMSFRFSIPDGGDKWSTRSGDVDLREIVDTDTAECGPVVFPAYDQTTVSVRSLLAQLDPTEHRALLRELAAELGLATDLDLTGRSDARSTDGGDPDDEPGSGEASTVSINRQRLDHGALQLRRILK